MDALDVALRESQQQRLAEAQRVHKARKERRRAAEVARKGRRLWGLRARHSAKLARILPG